MDQTTKLPPTPTLCEYEFHELADMFPLIEGDEYDALVSAIQRQGLLNPITLFKGKILDGRNRYRAAKEAGHKFTARDYVELPQGVDPEEFVISANIHRRQLNNKQKREFIAKLIRKKPSESDRVIGKRAGVDGKTVASVREELKRQSKEFAKTWKNFSDADRQEFVKAFLPDLQRLMA
jgi:ParB-like chromosome segregation protein Spo0J